jgi:hypothetical protein
MALSHGKAYTLVLLSSLVGAALGCDSKKTAPPPGAPAETESPSVDLGSESSAPKDTPGDANASPEGAGTPSK